MKQVPEIMATIGPTLEKPEDLRRAVEAGARWFRLPCGYRQRPHVENARDIRAVAAEVDVPVRLLAGPAFLAAADRDHEGPATGGRGSDPVVGFSTPGGTARRSRRGIRSRCPELHGLLDKIAPGHRIWFCDGRLEFVVDEVRDDGVLARLNSGTILLKSSNSIYLPDSASPFTMVTADDLTLLDRFAQAGIVPDWVALSLISTPEDVLAGRKEIEHYLGKRVRVMAKIETQAAVDRVESILEVADGTMVARGDLGPAVRFVGLPEAEARIVAAARRAGKPVVVATQILEYYAEQRGPVASRDLRAEPDRPRESRTPSCWARRPCSARGPSSASVLPTRF